MTELTLLIVLISITTVLTLINTAFLLHLIKLEKQESKEINKITESEVIVKCEDIRDYVATPKSKDEVFTGERKYDPNKIQGAFDSFFKD